MSERTRNFSASAYIRSMCVNVYAHAHLDLCRYGCIRTTGILGSVCCHVCRPSVSFGQFHGNGITIPRPTIDYMVVKYITISLASHSFIVSQVMVSSFLNHAVTDN